MIILIYLDNAATTPVLPEVLDAMLPYYRVRYGNPSSLHLLGRQAREAVEASRAKVAAFIGATDKEIVFTSGGTEADNLAVKGVAYALRKKGRHIITSQIEHHAVLRACSSLEQEGFDVTYLPVDSTGLVDPARVEDAITDRTVLISIMHANNEVGTIEPLESIGRVAQETGIVFHTDAVQTLGHIPVSVDRLGVDLLSASGHKLYGPKGIGALYVREGTEIQPLLHGGGQERKRRASTENVAGIVGFAKSIEVAESEMIERERRVQGLRDRLVRGVLEGLDQSYLNGHPTCRLPGNANLTIRHVEGEAMVLALDALDICTSTGSACSSGELEPSHVLQAMGLPPVDIHSSIRLSVGATNTSEEVDYAIEAVIESARKLRVMSPLYRPPSHGGEAMEVEEFPSRRERRNPAGDG